MDVPILSRVIQLFFGTIKKIKILFYKVINKLLDVIYIYKDHLGSVALGSILLTFFWPIKIIFKLCELLNYIICIFYNQRSWNIMYWLSI